MQKKITFLAATLLATLALGGCSLFYPNPGSSPTPVESPSASTPSTEAPAPTTEPEPTLKQIDLNILDASAFKDNGTVDVIAEALQILEDDGNCTLKVTQGQKSQTVTVKAESNVTSTQCFPMSVPIASFKNGEAKYTVSYKSEKYSGTISGTLTVQ